MLKVTKLWSVPLKRAYAVSNFITPNGLWVFAGSETDGGVLLMEVHRSKIKLHNIIPDAAGVMQIFLQHGGVPLIVFISGFLPPFKAEDTTLMLARPRKGLYETWQTMSLYSLPYLHRFGFLKKANKLWIILSTIAKTKKSPDDWSVPGETLIARWYHKRNGRVYLKQVRKLFSMSLNHGLVVRKNRAYVCGAEGVIEVNPLGLTRKSWKVTHLIEREVSDAWFADIDGDGVDEMITIEPFHGDNVIINKRLNKKWYPIAQAQGHFCHAIWGGRLHNRAIILVGNRGGDRAIDLFEYHLQKHSIVFRQHVDLNVGTTQFTVFQKEKTIIISANNSSDEVACYEIQ